MPRIEIELQRGNETRRQLLLNQKSRTDRVPCSWVTEFSARGQSATGLLGSGELSLPLSSPHPQRRPSAKGKLWVRRHRCQLGWLEENLISLRPPTGYNICKHIMSTFLKASLLSFNVFFSTRASSSLHDFMNTSKASMRLHPLHDLVGLTECWRNVRATNSPKFPLKLLTQIWMMGVPGLLAFLLRECKTWREGLCSACSTRQVTGGPARQSGRSAVQDRPEGQFHWMSLLTSNLIFRSDAAQERSSSASVIRTSWLGKGSLWVLIRDLECQHRWSSGKLLREGTDY